MTDKPEAKTPQEEPFEIELEGITRDYDAGFGTESYDVTFDCRRDGEIVEATVELDAEDVATLDIVPNAMSRLHRVFSVLS